jgi:hypothetical protein
MNFKRFFVGVLLLLTVISNLFAISDSDKAILQQNEDYLFLSLHVYDLEFLQGDRIGIQPYPNIWDKGKEWKVIEYKDVPSTGFTAAIYQNDNLKKLVISFAGTTGGENDLKDIIQDLTMIDKKASLGQFEEAKNIINKAKTKASELNYSLEFTGHSLGGALAQFAGLDTGLKTVTFNTAPYSLSGEVYTLLSFDGRTRIKQKNNHILNIRAVNDYVSALALSIDAIPQRDSIGIKAVNGQVIYLGSLKSGHTLAQMIREYDSKYSKHFGTTGIVTELYKQYSIFIDASAHLVIDVGGDTIETYIVVSDTIKDRTKNIAIITYDTAKNLTVKVLDTVEDNFVQLTNYLNISIDSSYESDSLNTKLSMGTGALSILDNLHFDKLGNITLNAVDVKHMQALTNTMETDFEAVSKLANEIIVNLDRDIKFYANNPQLKQQLLASKATQKAVLKELETVKNTKISKFKSLSKIGTAMNIYSLTTSTWNIYNKIEENKKITVLDGLDVLSNVIAFNPIGAVGSGLYAIEKEIDNAMNITHGINDSYRESIWSLRDRYFRQYHTLADRGFQGKEGNNFIELYKSQREGLRKEIIDLKETIEDTIILFGKAETLRILDDTYALLAPSKEDEIVAKQQNIYNKFYGYYLEREKAKQEQEHLRSIRLSDVAKPSQPNIIASSIMYDTDQNITLSAYSKSSEDSENIVYHWYYSPSASSFATGKSIKVTPKSKSYETYYVKAFNTNGESLVNSITLYHKEYKQTPQTDIILKPYTVEDADGHSYTISDFFLNGVVNGNLILEGGTLDLQGGTLTVNGNFIQSEGTLKINGGKLIVKGDMKIATADNGGS